MSMAMPKGVRLYNGSTEPCDMLHGPCCCGAWHTPEEIVKKLAAEVACLTNERDVCRREWDDKEKRCATLERARLAELRHAEQAEARVAELETLLGEWRNARTLGSIRFVRGRFKEGEAVLRKTFAALREKRDDPTAARTRPG